MLNKIDSWLAYFEEAKRLRQPIKRHAQIKSILGCLRFCNEQVSKRAPDHAFVNHSKSTLQQIENAISLGNDEIDLLEKALTEGKALLDKLGYGLIDHRHVPLLHEILSFPQRYSHFAVLDMEMTCKEHKDETFNDE